MSQVLTVQGIAQIRQKSIPAENFGSRRDGGIMRRLTWRLHWGSSYALVSTSSRVYSGGRGGQWWWRDIRRRRSVRDGRARILLLAANGRIDCFALLGQDGRRDGGSFPLLGRRHRRQGSVRSARNLTRERKLGNVPLSPAQTALIRYLRQVG